MRLIVVAVVLVALSLCLSTQQRQKGQRHTTKVKSRDKRTQMSKIMESKQLD